MSKNLGYVQRAVTELIESSGAEDVGWTTGWLCEHIYGKNSKSQRTALIRAIKKMKLPPGFARSGQPRAELKSRSPLLS
jgi:hypothetical protein